MYYHISLQMEFFQKIGNFMEYRLGLDLGTNSIGWVILKLIDDKPMAIIKSGVRIFPDGRKKKDKTSLAVSRRLARQTRRMRDRYLKRQKRLMNHLIEFGLMPSTESERNSLQQLDPYKIRKKGLDNLLKPEELGRAIFHLSKRRGFKSNRKIDSSARDSGIVKSSIDKTRLSMKKTGFRTYGEWLYRRREAGEGVLARTCGEGAKKAYEVYADRALIEDELIALWDAQKKLKNSYCTDLAFRAIRNTIFFQRDLLPVLPGKCSLETDQPRAPKADIRVQQFRIFQELNHIKVIDEDYNSRSLTLEERNKIAKVLSKGTGKKSDKIAKLIGLPEACELAGSAKTGDVKGNETVKILSKSEHFGKAWHNMPEAKQIDIVNELLTNESEEATVKYLQQQVNITIETAKKIANCRLPEGYSNYSLLAIEKILPKLKEQVITKDKADLLAGYTKNNFDCDKVFDQLPYYGEILERYTGKPNENSSNSEEAKYGRIANPTVHIALNELRKVVNAIIVKYGHPSKIVIEVVRDLKNSAKVRKQISQKNEENKKNNAGYAKELENLGLRNSYENRQRFILWEELAPSPLDRKCPFTGEQISIAKLFSPEVEVEHIIPFSRCLDGDNLGNKTLSMRKANRDKGNLTPYEAFGQSTNGYSWDHILDRADKLPPSKKMRFAPDAAEKFADQEKWLARQLTDTAYISTIARQYLTAICQKNSVYVVPGRLTKLLRDALGLNRLIGNTAQKERHDHRHHAIDALVVGLIDRSLLQRASRHAKYAREQGFKRILQDMPRPWENFVEQASDSIGRIVTSHKPDHGIEAALHNDTAYGLVEKPNKDGVSKLVHRKSLIEELKKSDLPKIRDRKLAQSIKEYTNQSQLTFNAAVKEFSQANKVYRCRVVESITVIPIKCQNGIPYKYYKGDGNYCYEIFENEKGQWTGRVITTFEANQSAYKKFLANTKVSRKYSFCGKKLTMRLCGDDIIVINKPARTLFRVVRISEGAITLASINEANVAARNRDPDNPFKLFSKAPSALQKLKARRVFIDVIGNIKDPGFKEDES
jgi:CRISPR-associated endonuclease Csn1